MQYRTQKNVKVKIVQKLLINDKCERQMHYGFKKWHIKHENMNAAAI
jgi:hypothetical protein